ncbi:MAG: NAD(P)/FAD-dependent oxidoreductase [Chloroflexi bacterium]|nr:NAD(P)/FAD-dependent oxidoreductase [Chloroflexota bacterium]
MEKALDDRYDVIIVGAGPAGIFAGLELCQNSNLRVLMVEKGKPIERRRCPIIGKTQSCYPCSPCDLVSGWGGAGAFSDGKLTLSPEVGGRLKEYLGKEKTDELIHYVDRVFLDFGASDQIYGEGDGVVELRRRASLADLRLVPMSLRHLGTERCKAVLRQMYDFLASRVDFLTGACVTNILTEDSGITGIETKNGHRLGCQYLIVAPGREGADWLAREAQRLHLKLENNPVDVGIRVEVPAAVLEELTNVLYESKLEYYSKTFDDRVRTFCMCPWGEVTMESTAGSDPVMTVNGHSYADRRTNNSNFALLVSTNFTDPFHEPIAYGRYLARLANILSGGIMVQRLGDLLEGQRSTPARIQRGIVEPTLKSATPGDLSFVLPYRYLRDIMEMLTAMDKLAPGVASRHTLLYGVEVKFYSSRLQLTAHLESQLKNLFAAGDGAGVSRGLTQAAASGVVIAREILKRTGELADYKVKESLSAEVR